MNNNEKNQVKEMFCFQCEQTLGGKACTRAGVCGKSAACANKQDSVIKALIYLAGAYHEGEAIRPSSVKLMEEGLFATLTNVNFDEEALQELIDRIVAEAENIAPGSAPVCPIDDTPLLLWGADEDTRSLKALVIFGLKGLAAYAYHADMLGYHEEEVDKFYFHALREIAKNDITADELVALALELGKVNYQCMALLDKANTASYGVPVPEEVSLTIEKGPFIVVSGHDLKDLELLLKQSKDKGVNIYTHGEMLPAHAYPKLKAYPHFKGHFGTAWHNQQREFMQIPGAFLFTTNCLMPPNNAYKDNIFTTGAVHFPDVAYIDEDKDFTPVIEKAKALGGYAEDKHFHGLNGGEKMTTGFNYRTVLSLAEPIIEAVMKGEIKHFLLVGGCDGNKREREYYTNLVKSAPKDTIILTLGCLKFRFNDLDLGTVAGLPRLLDMGQCNDAYSALQVALALADAFDCGVNELPLSLVLGWYEQKAAAILLTLLALGVKNIKLGPTLPAFISPNVLDVLVKNYNIAPITTVEEDLRGILGE